MKKKHGTGMENENPDEVLGVDGIERLGNFIMSEVPGEPSQDEGAVDVAIRLIRGCQDAPSASEALYMFMGWLTTRTEPVTLSVTNDAAIAAELINEFCITNDLPEPRTGWEKKMKHPT